MIVFLLLIISVLALLITFRLLSGDAPLFRIALPFKKGAGASAPAELPVAIDLPMEAQEVHPPTTEKFERLLLEKNQLIDRLQRQVEAERSHRMEFEKVREMLLDEISMLKEQNRGLKTKNATDPL